MPSTPRRRGCTAGRTREPVSCGKCYHCSKLPLPMSTRPITVPAAAPVAAARSRQSVAFRALAPLVIGGAVLLAPVPQGLTLNAWRFFALFLATISGVIFEPIPGAAVGLLGVSIAAVLGLVRPVGAPATAWALSGFSNSTVWLVFAAYMFA